MQFSQNIAKHLREVIFGGNWTCSTLKEQLADVTWEEATTQVYELNSIATLVQHMTYYVDRVIPVFQGGTLDAKDADSFKHPPINSQEDWEQFLLQKWENANSLIAEVEKLEDAKLGDIFVGEKYGIYYRNLHGIIEHLHYHLGQVAIIKKVIRARK